jgi:hypothetical protein
MIRIPKVLELAAYVAIPCIIVACMPPEEPARVAPVETTSVTSAPVAQPAPQPIVVQTQPAPRPTSTTVIVNNPPPPPASTTVVTTPSP